MSFGSNTTCLPRAPQEPCVVTVAPIARGASCPEPQQCGCVRSFRAAPLKRTLLQHVGAEVRGRQAWAGQEKWQLPPSPQLWHLLVLQLREVSPVNHQSGLSSKLWCLVPWELVPFPEWSPRDPNELQGEVPSSPPHFHRTNPRGQDLGPVRGRQNDCE